MTDDGGVVTAAVRDESSDERSAPEARTRRVLEGVLGVPATEGNRIDVLRNGDAIFPAMLAAVGEARHTIDLLTFVYWEGEIGAAFADALSERARQGVRVRVLLDSWGARPVRRELLGVMEAAGVRVRWFRPLRHVLPGQVNRRTHRKVMIVDEAVGFTGGVGIADEWQGDARDENEWRDTHFRIEGPAVDGLRAAFLDNWAETDPELFTDGVDRFPDQPKPGGALVQCVRGASETGLSDIATLFRTLIQLANSSINITTAYFVPESELDTRLIEAAERGVRVRIVVPGPYADKRFVQVAGEANYDNLLEHGVELFHFQPTMLHAKVMTVDGLVANVGSANLNTRSVNWDEEINVVAIDRDLVRVLDEQFEDDLDRSMRIERGRWKRRPARQRVAEAALRPVKRWF